MKPPNPYDLPAGRCYWPECGGADDCPCDDCPTDDLEVLGAATLTPDPARPWLGSQGGSAVVCRVGEAQGEETPPEPPRAPLAVGQAPEAGA